MYLHSLICSKCPLDLDCQHERDNCERYQTIRDLLEKEIGKLALEFHICYTGVENDEN